MNATPSEPITPEHLFLAQNSATLNNRYLLKDGLGSGGFAWVYLAFDQRIERQVAIKVLRFPSGFDRMAWMAHQERFLIEAQAAARIEHANVVTIHDIDVCDKTGHPFIVMERLVGKPLCDLIDDAGKGMEPTRAIRLARQCLAALAEGHRLGIVHRDIKPSNIFVLEPGSPLESAKVVDFGIAHLTDRDTPLTATGEVIGTARYMAPEYIRHQQVTPAVDVYQMGLVLAELLIGQPVVLDTDIHAAYHRHCEGTLALPEGILQGPLGRVIATALHPDPQQRYPDAASFAHALRRLERVRIPQPTLTRWCVLSDARQWMELDDERLPPARVRTPEGDLPPAAQNKATLKVGVGPQTKPHKVQKPPRRWGMAVLPAMAISFLSTGLLMGLLAGGAFSSSITEHTPHTAAIPQASASITAAAPQTHAPPKLPEPTNAPAPTDDAPAQPKPTPPTAKHTPTSPQLVTVELNSRPKRAGVYSKTDGKRLGFTPMTVKVDPENPQELVLWKTGYHSERLTIDGTQTDLPKVRLKWHGKRRDNSPTLWIK